MRSFLDTNVLVYADASDAAQKQTIAIELIAGLHRASDAVLSTQVLQEFVNVALRKLKLPAASIRQRLDFYSRFEIVPTSAELISTAFELHAVRALSFYDALIVQAAISSGCEELLSEDLQAGEIISGVRIRNPFVDQPSE